MSELTPQASVEWVLRCVLSKQDADAVVGDLIEEYHSQRRLTPTLGAWSWYWKQLGRSLPPLLWAGITRGRCWGTLGAAFLALVITQFVEFVGEIAIMKMFGAGALVSMILGLAVGLWAALLGGYIADTMRQGAAVVLAVVAFSIVAVMMMTMSDKPPLWYQIGFLVFAPAAALSGGALTRRGIVC